MSKKGKNKLSLFGDVLVKFSKLKGESATLTGLRFGLNINQKFSICAAGYGLISRISYSFADQSGKIWELPIVFRYGGVFLEYIINPQKKIHFSIGTLIGVGGVTRSYPLSVEKDVLAWGNFFIVEPEFNIILNINESSRFGLGFCYRYLSGVTKDWISNANLRGVSFHLILRLGKL